MTAVGAIVGITEMYVPVLLVTETATKAKFFVAVLAVSQLIFFSSVGPMIMDMFSDIQWTHEEMGISYGPEITMQTENGLPMRLTLI